MAADTEATYAAGIDVMDALKAAESRPAGLVLATWKNVDEQGNPIVVTLKGMLSAEAVRWALLARALGQQAPELSAHLDAAARLVSAMPSEAQVPPVPADSPRSGGAT